MSQFLATVAMIKVAFLLEVLIQSNTEASSESIIFNLVRGIPGVLSIFDPARSASGGVNVLKLPVSSFLGLSPDYNLI